MPKVKALTHAQRERARRKLAGDRGVAAHEITELDIADAMASGQLSVTACGPNPVADHGGGHSPGVGHSASFTDTVSAPSTDAGSC